MRASSYVVSPTPDFGGRLGLSAALQRPADQSLELGRRELVERAFYEMRSAVVE